MATATDSLFSIRTHNGTVTVKNPATGQHRTFRIRTNKDDANFAPGKRVVGLLTGPDNENDFRPFGFVLDGGRIAVWMKHRGTEFDRFARLLEDLDGSAARWNLFVEWSVKCRKCNRELTTPDSIQSGIGPICSGME